MRSVQLDVTIGLIVVDGVFVGCVTDDVCVCVCVCVDATVSWARLWQPSTTRSI